MLRFFWQGLIIVKGNPHALETVFFWEIASLKGSGNVKMSRGVFERKIGNSVLAEFSTGSVSL